MAELAAYDFTDPDVRQAYKNVFARENGYDLNDSDVNSLLDKQLDELISALPDAGERPSGEGILGSFGDFGRGFAEGVVSDVPQATGRGLQWLDPDDGSNFVEGIGQKIEEFGKKREGMFPESEASVKAREGNALDPRGWWYEGARSLPNSLVPISAGAIGLAGGPVTAGVLGGSAMFNNFYAATAEQAYRESGDLTHANIQGGVEFGGELVQDIIAAAPVFNFLSAPVKGALIKSVFAKQGIKGAAKTMGKVIVGEELTESAQQGLQTAADIEYGVRPDADVMRDISQVWGPTLVMSTIFAGFGVGGGAYRRAQARKILENPDAPTEQVSAVVDMVAGHVAKEDKGLAELFKKKSMELHNQGQPIILHDDAFYQAAEQEQTATEQQEPAPVTTAGDILGPSPFQADLQDPVVELSPLQKMDKEMWQAAAGSLSLQDNLMPKPVLPENPLGREWQQQTQLARAYAQQRNVPIYEPNVPMASPEVERQNNLASLEANTLRPSTPEESAATLAAMPENTVEQRLKRQEELEQVFNSPEYRNSLTNQQIDAAMTEYEATLPIQHRTVATKKGVPFATKNVAGIVLKTRGLTVTHQVTPVEGGFVLSPVTPQAEQTPVVQPTSPAQIAAPQEPSTERDMMWDFAETGQSVQAQADATKRKRGFERLVTKDEADTTNKKAREIFKQETQLEEEEQKDFIPPELAKLVAQEAEKSVRANPFYGMMADAKKRGGISKDSFGKDYGLDTINALNKKYPGLISSLGKVQPDELADEQGFRSLDEMVQAFLSTPSMKAEKAKIIAQKRNEWAAAEEEAQAAIAAEPPAMATTPASVEGGAAQPTFNEMVDSAAKWKGAAIKVDRTLVGNNKARVAHSRMTTKGDLDSYLMKKYGISESEAREVSNELTRKNIPANENADIEEFKDEPWASSLIKAPTLTKGQIIDIDGTPVKYMGIDPLSKGHSFSIPVGEGQETTQTTRDTSPEGLKKALSEAKARFAKPKAATPDKAPDASAEVTPVSAPKGATFNPYRGKADYPDLKPAEQPSVATDESQGARGAAWRQLGQEVALNLPHDASIFKPQPKDFISAAKKLGITPSDAALAWKYANSDGDVALPKRNSPKPLVTESMREKAEQPSVATVTAPSTEAKQASAETIADFVKSGKAKFAEMHHKDGDVFTLSLKPDTSTPGVFSVITKNSEGRSRTNRMQYAAGKSIDEVVKDFSEYMNIDNPGDYTVTPISRKEKTITTPSERILTGSAERDELLKRYRKAKKEKRPMSAGQEQALARYEKMVIADPAKWQPGMGVGWNVVKGQINRGFVIDSINPERKEAVIRQVADTGLTRTGGDNDKIGKQTVHIVDLIRDKKYDAVTTPTRKPLLSQEPPSPEPQPEVSPTDETQYLKMVEDLQNIELPSIDEISEIANKQESKIEERLKYFGIFVTTKENGEYRFHDKWDGRVEEDGFSSVDLDGDVGFGERINGKWRLKKEVAALLKDYQKIRRLNEGIPSDENLFDFLQQAENGNIHPAELARFHKLVMSFVKDEPAYLDISEYGQKLLQQEVRKEQVSEEAEGQKKISAKEIKRFARKQTEELFGTHSELDTIQERQDAGEDLTGAEIQSLTLADEFMADYEEAIRSGNEQTAEYIRNKVQIARGEAAGTVRETAETRDVQPVTEVQARTATEQGNKLRRELGLPERKEGEVDEDPPYEPSDRVKGARLIEEHEKKKIADATARKLKRETKESDTKYSRTSQPSGRNVQQVEQALSNNAPARKAIAAGKLKVVQTAAELPGDAVLLYSSELLDNDIPTIIFSDNLEVEEEASYDAKEDIIYISSKLSETRKNEVLKHELEHRKQGKEGKLPESKFVSPYESIGGFMEYFSDPAEVFARAKEKGEEVGEIWEEVFRLRKGEGSTETKIEKISEITINSWIPEKPISIKQLGYNTEKLSDKNKKDLQSISEGGDSNWHARRLTGTLRPTDPKPKKITKKAIRLHLANRGNGIIAASQLKKLGFEASSGAPYTTDIPITEENIKRLWELKGDIKQLLQLPLLQRPKYSRQGQVAGAYYANKDTMYLVADGIQEGQELPVAYHESFHRAEELGELQPILDELGRIEKMAGNKGVVADWFAKAREAFAKAQGIEEEDENYAEKIEKLKEHPNYFSELGAYAVQQYTESPNIIKRWVDKLIAKVKSSIFKVFGLFPGKLDPALMREIAISGLKAKGVVREDRAAATEPLWSQVAKDFGITIKEAKRQYDDVVKEFKGTDGWMKAPNGEPTKLNERQWVQVQTPAFKEWFGNSKVVDENGEPLVVYHGTSARVDFSKFEPMSHFGTAEAADFRNYGGRGRSFPVFLSIKNPLKSTDNNHKGSPEWPIHLIEEGDVVSDNEFFMAEKRYSDDYETETKNIIKLLTQKGFDGATYRNVTEDPGHYSYITFSPNQIKSAIGNTGQFSPSDDIRYSMAAKEELDGMQVEMRDRWHKGKADINKFNRWFETIEKYARKVPVVARYWEAIRDRRDLKVQYENAQFNVGERDYVKEADSLSRKDHKTYSDYMVEKDATFSEYTRRQNADGSWTAYTPGKVIDGKKISTKTRFEGKNAEDQATQHLFDTEYERNIADGMSKPVAEIIRTSRMVYNAGLKMSMGTLITAQEEAKKAGLEEPTIGIRVQDAKFKVTKKGKEDGRAFRLFKNAEEAQEFIDGRKNPDEWTHTELETAEDTEQLTIDEVINKIGDLVGNYFPRKRNQGDVILRAYDNKGNETYMKMFDIAFSEDWEKGKGIETLKKMVNIGMGKFQKYIIGADDLHGTIREMKKKGWRVEISENTQLSEDVFEAKKLMVSMQNLLDEALKATPEEKQEAAHELNKLLTVEIAKLFMMRGSLSSRLKRKQTVIAGYETDAVKATISHVKGIAGGMAKRETSERAMKIILGRDNSWEEYQDENPEAEYKDYMKYVDERRLDPGKQKEAYGAVMSNFEWSMRNQTKLDRVVGTLKGLAVLKFLGFRLSSPAVNMTAMLTNVPAEMHSKGISFADASKHLTQASTAYVGKRSFSYKAIFEYINKKGWDAPQFNQDAAGFLMSQAGKGYDYIMSKAMWLFGVTEKMNRAVTIAASYTALGGKVDIDGKVDAALMKKARNISDEAHGVYQKETIPEMAMGEGLPAAALRTSYTFMKFTHNYLSNVKKYGFSTEHDLKAMTWLLLSPAVLAGTSASIVSTLAFAIAKGLGYDDPEEDFYKWVEDNIGVPDRITRQGLAGVAGVDIRGSLGIRWGVPTTMKELLGAPYAVGEDTVIGIKKLAGGEIGKGVEKILPTGLAAPFKAIREYNEGVTTESNQRVFGEDDQPLKGSWVDAVTRVLTFNPAGLAAEREKLWHGKEKSKMYAAGKAKIYTDMRKYLLSEDRNIADWAELLLRVDDFNMNVIGNDDKEIITESTIKSLIKQMRVRGSKERMKTAQTMRKFKYYERKIKFERDKQAREREFAEVL